MNLHSIIKETYGPDCVKQVRKLEDTSRKLARFRNHLHFSLHCKHHDVTPRSLKLNSTVQGCKADNILKRAERALLNVRIGQITGKIKRIKDDSASLTTAITSSITCPRTCREVDEFTAHAHNAEFQRCKQRQIGKFERLRVKTEEKTPTISQECISKWVKNCSSRILKDPELSVLARGMNFAVTPSKPPVTDIITATETACKGLPDGEASDLRARVSGILRKHKNIKSNITKEERAAISELKKDKNIKILPADKGKCTVVLDTDTYKSKCLDLLNDTKTYEKLSRDPTPKYKKELVAILKSLKDTDSIDEKVWRQIYPTTDTPPRFYGLPKIHKAHIPLRPIVSSIGSITYHCSKHLAEIISPLIGKTPHHIKNSQDFSKVIQARTIQPHEELRSYDVTALFTSVPVDKATECIRKKLLQDPSLYKRTKMSPGEICTLLEFCLGCTYFLYDGQFYRQIHGAAMGSPVSMIVCDAMMEDLEERAIATAPHPPHWWFRYVDDTHTKLDKDHAQEFTDHLNSLDDNIKFTTEDEEEGKLAFLDTNTVRMEDGSMKVTIYRKPTHTDQYLSFASNHPLQHKRGVVRTLLHRADHVVTEEEDRTREKEHVKQALSKCGYPRWLLNMETQPNTVDNTPETEKKESTRKCSVALPYVKGLSEELRRVFRDYGCNAFHKPRNTLRQLLCAPKDPAKNEDKTGVVYMINCEGEGKDTPCTSTYIGETARSLKARAAEHRRPSSTTSEVSQHLHLNGRPKHHVSLDKIKILDRDDDWLKRGIKESIYIRALKPDLNRDGGRHHLPSVWDVPIKLSDLGAPRSNNFA